MDEELLQAATSGNLAAMRHIQLHDPDKMRATTPYDNTWLHLASILHGREQFCLEALALSLDESSLLASAVNSDGETPLIAAAASGHVSLACALLTRYKDLGLDEEILRQDRSGCNALHHAIRNGHRALALRLIEDAPDLSICVDNCVESPMFLAVMRDYEDVFQRLLEIPVGCPDSGIFGYNALHAAVRNGNTGEKLHKPVP